MNRSALRLLFGLTVIAATGYVYMTCAALPDPLASHFGFDGHADTRMPRDSYRALMTGVTLVIPLGVVLLQVWLPRVFVRSINIPRRDYWLATAERRARTLDYLESHALVTGLVPPVFFAAIQRLIVDANTRMPPQLDNQWFYVLAGAFVVCMVLAGLTLVVHFRRAE